MKKIDSLIYILTFSLLTSLTAASICQAREDGDPSLADLFQELEASATYGIQSAGLFESTSEVLMNELIHVGGETAILSDHTRWKSQFQGVVFVNTKTSPPQVKIHYKKGEVDLNAKYPMTSPDGTDVTNPAVDLSDAALNARNSLFSSQSGYPVFEMAIRCLGYGGQGLPAQIACGFFKDPRDFN